MNKKRNWVIAVIVTATAGVFALEKVSAPSLNALQTNIITATPSDPSPITLTPTYEGCGFMWAYHDDPELSATINKAIGALDPTAKANAQLFGEDCVYADGHSTFGAMETDFYVRLSVKDLNAPEKFGNWMKEILDTIGALPDDKVQGHKGFVEFSFKNETEQILIRVEMQDYISNASRVSGASLFQKYYTPSPPTTQIPSTPIP